MDAAEVPEWAGIQHVRTLPILGERPLQEIANTRLEVYGVTSLFQDLSGMVSCHITEQTPVKAALIEILRIWQLALNAYYSASLKRT